MAKERVVEGLVVVQGQIVEAPRNIYADTALAEELRLVLLEQVVRNMLYWEVLLPDVGYTLKMVIEEEDGHR